MAASELNALEDSIRKTGGGFMTGVRGWLAQKGWLLDTKASDLQATLAFINRLIPSQRIPGMGAIRVVEWKSFERSLPSLINTPEANERIIGTMRKVIQYRQGRAEIASHVFDGTLTSAGGLQEIRELEKDLDMDNLSRPQQPPQSQTQAPQLQTQLQPQIGEIRKGYRFKGGNPANPTSWERVQ